MENTTALLPLTQGRFALIDKEDFDDLNRHKWCTTPRGYVMRRLRASEGDDRKKCIYLHAYLMRDELARTGLPEVDHRDGNPLNNQKSNLRVSTHAQQCMNRRINRKLPASGYKGVSPMPEGNYRARVRKRSVGRFPTAEEAARAYDKAARRLFGEFARCNFPEEA